MAVDRLVGELETDGGEDASPAVPIGIGHGVDEGDVGHLPGRDPSPGGHGPVAGPAHPLDPLAPDLVGIDVVAAVGPPQRGVERRARRDHVDRVAVGVHDVGVGELGQQRRRGSRGAPGVLSTNGRERLAPLPLLPLEQLEHPAQPPVGRREVLGVDPRPVARARRRTPRGCATGRRRPGRRSPPRPRGRRWGGWRTARRRRCGSAPRAPRRRRCAGRRRRGPSRVGAPARPPPSRRRRRGGGRWPAPAGAASCPTASCRRPRSAPRSARRGSRGARSTTARPAAAG